MVSDTKQCTDGTMLYNICYSDKTGVPHIVFNNIDCYFKKSSDYNFLVFCDKNKNKNMVNIYLEFIKQLKDEIFSLIDEFEDEEFVFGYNSLGFRFKTDEYLVNDEKINIPVCVISLSSVIKGKWIHFQYLNHENVFMKVFLKNKKPFSYINIKDG